MKKLIAIALSVLMILGMFAGCTAENAGPGENTYNLKTVKEGYLTVITSPDYAPYEFYALDEQGNPSLAGFDMALAQYIADYLGLELEVVPMDFDGVLTELATGSVDLGLPLTCSGSSSTWVGRMASWASWAPDLVLNTWGLP